MMKDERVIQMHSHKGLYAALDQAAEVHQKPFVYMASMHHNTTVMKKCLIVFTLCVHVS